MKFSDLTEHEKRILRYLDQRGLTHRETMVVDLASENSRIASRARNGRRYVCGSNGATPMIAYNWTKRLVKVGFVVDHRDRRHFHHGYAITRTGQQLIRAGSDE